MPEKVRLSRLIIKVSGLLSIFTSAVIIILIIYGRTAVGPGKEIGQLSGLDILSALGLALAAAALIFGLLGWITVSGITSQKKWSWVTSFFISLVLTLLFPLGTIFGIKLLVNLFHRESKAWFGWEAAFVSQNEVKASASAGIDLDLLQAGKEENPEEKNNS
ncbi:MAG: hypothetical protein ACPLZD_02835 [Candidatus Saccharicenans sp.]|nr:MAG: hypothetical protein C0168_10460 [Candidatus Aminicenantes bacterium]HEK86499.1 hypothetical protein [Candidatus Aminicenantes bacterium]